jgi:hypothetical protein
MVEWRGPFAIRSLPSVRRPLPASMMIRVSPAQTSTQDVLPPAAYSGPGVGIEPRTPRKRTVRSLVMEGGMSTL